MEKHPEIRVRNATGDLIVLLTRVGNYLQKLCRVATAFLFCGVVCHRNPEYFDAILARDNLSGFTKLISIGRADDAGHDLLIWIRSDRSLRHLTVRPAIAIVQQAQCRQFTTTHADMDPRRSSVYYQWTAVSTLAPHHWTSKSSIHHGDHSIVGEVCMEFTDRPESKWDYWYRQVGCISTGPYRYEEIACGNRAIVSTLRPHDPSEHSTGTYKAGFEWLRTELVEQIDPYSQLNGNGHERSLLRNIHTE